MARKSAATVSNPAERRYDRIMQEIAGLPRTDSKWDAMMSAAENVALTERENGERLRGEAWYELWLSSYDCALEVAQG